jgi:signal transduction histidine kinase
MFRFSSFGSKLRASFLALSLAAIAVTGWEATAGATAALRQSTYDRLNAIHQTRCRQIERYFEDVGHHVLALSADESTVRALEEFRDAWTLLPASGAERTRQLRSHYETAGLAEQWFPADPRIRALQYFFIAGNPHPAGSKDLLLTVPEAGLYGQVHSRYHPTLHRYQSAFGFYDIFLIEARQGRVLYTVLKEIDLGVTLSEAPYRETTLARAFRKAMTLKESEKAVVEDYAPYAPSGFAPASFLAAPIRRAGAVVGVLAIQVSVDEVNRVMHGDRRWQQEGLGETGHAYIVGADGALRSDTRFEIERPNEYFAQLKKAGVGSEVLDRIRRHGTAILNLRINRELVEHLKGGGRETEIGVDLRGVPVLRAHARLDVAGLEWSLVAEIEAQEALAPVRSLRNRIAGVGLLVAGVFVLAATLLARSVTRPVLALTESARKLGAGDFRIRIPVTSDDEIGQLADSFNRMAEDLERTTVSKEELEKLAGRLITAQEEERSRLARELHDDLTQRLAAVAIEAGRLQRLHDPKARNEGLERIKQQMARLSDDIHGLSRRLHPSTLDDLGLVAAIESECRGFFERGGTAVNFLPVGSMDDLPKAVALSLYRIVQEGLRNIYRHSAAEQVTIRLQRAGGTIQLEIEDDGRGFDRADPGWRPGLGLASMEERARLLNGTLRIRSAPGDGTSITASLPLGDRDEKAHDSAG